MICLRYIHMEWRFAMQLSATVNSTPKSIRMFTLGMSFGLWPSSNAILIIGKGHKGNNVSWYKGSKNVHCRFKICTLTLHWNYQKTLIFILNKTTKAENIKKSNSITKLKDEYLNDLFP